MSTDLILKRTATGPRIDAESVTKALAEISEVDGLKCHLASDGRSILIGARLPAGDERGAGVTVSFEADGSELSGSTRSGGGPLLSWCLHALAAKLECRLFDPQTGGRPKPNSQRFLAEAKARVIALENDILANEPAEADADVEADADTASALSLLVGFLRSLVAADQLSLTADATALTDLVPHLNEPSDLYEALLDSPLVDDVFLSESEFIRALDKFRKGWPQP